MSQTFILLKPDAMERGLDGEIISRFEKQDLKIVDSKTVRVEPELAKKHYAEHIEKDFYPELEEFIGRSDCLAMILEGPDDIVSIVREMVGATDPAKADKGTIRGDYGKEVTENLVHASDSDESAVREISLFFG